VKTNNSSDAIPDMRTVDDPNAVASIHQEWTVEQLQFAAKHLLNFHR
jgi:hypothetical protein